MLTTLILAFAAMIAAIATAAALDVPTPSHDTTRLCQAIR